MNDAGLGYCRDLVCRQDPDRFLVAMLSPAPQRAALLSIYAFNIEVSKIRESVSEPILGEMRLQWWRDVIDTLYAGQPHGHAIAAPLSAAIFRHGLTKANFTQLIDARSADFDKTPPASVDDLADYAGSTAAPVIWLGLQVCGIEHSPAARDAGWNLGTAWALNGLIRALPFHLREGWCRLPLDLLSKYRLDQYTLLKQGGSSSLRKLIKELSELIDNKLEISQEGRRNLGRDAIPALRFIGLTEAYQRRLVGFDFDPFDRRVAMRPPLIAWRLMIRGLIGR